MYPIKLITWFLDFNFNFINRLTLYLDNNNYTTTTSVIFYKLEYL